MNCLDTVMVDVQIVLGMFSMTSYKHGLIIVIDIYQLYVEAKVLFKTSLLSLVAFNVSPHAATESRLNVEDV